jgi:hypothetical protein
MKNRIGSLLESIELAKTIGNGCVLSKFDVIELLGHIEALKEDSVFSGLFPPGEMTPPDGGPMFTGKIDNDLEKVIMDMYEYRDGQLSDVEIVQDIYKRLHESINRIVELEADIPLEQACKKISELSRQLQEANDDCLSLFGYGFHDTNCALAHGGAEYCTCGFDVVCNRHAERVSKL